MAEDLTENPPHRRRLTVVLRAFGAVCLAALLPLFMPAAWIGRTHEWLGWGRFPSQPVALYLARATSALSAFLGGLSIALSLDVRRYAPIIQYLAAGVMFYSFCGLVLGTAAGLPLWFPLADLIGCAIFCAPMWLLARRIERQRRGVLDRGSGRA